MNLLPEKVFDVVDWDAIELSLKSKPKMYNLWYGKQCSGWCGTNKKLKQWGQTTDSRCPNCHGFNEDAAHLMVCPCENRTKLFREQVRSFEEWMHTHHTDPELVPLVTDYLLGRGSTKFIRLSDLPRYFRGLALSQDKIGWRNFTEGKVTKVFRRVQESYLASADTNLSADSWMKGFVGKLLAMTHSQWIFRCISKHHRTQGSLVIATKEELMKEIERQLDMGVDAIADEDRWMLEIDACELKEKSLADQQYWLYAVEAARQAGTRALELSEGATNKWSDIMKDGRFCLPTTTLVPMEKVAEEDEKKAEEENGEEMELEEKEDAAPAQAETQSAGISSRAAQNTTRSCPAGADQGRRRRRRTTNCTNGSSGSDMLKELVQERMSVNGGVPVEKTVQGHTCKVSGGAGAADVGRSQCYMSKNKSRKNRNREKQNKKTEPKKKSKKTKHIRRELPMLAT